ncbi:TIGR03759 family integrating conjugative element protein [Pseudomonas sp. 91RF]|jgi:integrating conjugative element protein (TIGR03759 family)|uniref:TIGR03759 family integrating conjugative element protein n=1 Tax=Pseudomonas sp. 91RF TaxID=2292261 RepID=UPI000E666767|nr:TIGR03759 family integrating conjugative element protein [Pseudomonas sp. 91RF]RIJ09686.1 TIGR03759 family integrating conjugative element protein [Pseudomonas sp. 91RF]
MSYLKILPSVLLPVCLVTLAQGPVARLSVETQAQQLPETEQHRNSAALAQQWGLKEEELRRFHTLMRGPLGAYSPNLDPLSALGIEARTDAERQRYALLQVEAEAARVEKLLAYQRAYDQAWKVRFPGMTLINVPPISSPLMSNPIARQAVFVRLDCPDCETTVRRLQTAGAAFDLYVVNSQQDDSRIRQWAQKVEIQPSKVRDGTITINHDNGRWASTGASGELPAVMRKVNGKWLRQ